MAKSAVLVDTTFPGYWMQFTPIVRRHRIESSFCGCTLTTINEYIAVLPTGMMLCVTRLIVFVPLWTFPDNLSASCPNYFDSPLFQRYLDFSSFNWIRSLYWSINTVSGLKWRWLGTMVTVHIKFACPCHELQSELLIPCGWYPPMWQDELLLAPPLNVCQGFVLVLPASLEMVLVVGIVLWGTDVS